PAAADILNREGELLTLVKPQFELDRSKISKNGIVYDPKGIYFNKIKDKITASSAENGFDLIGIIKSPLDGGDGNKEYLAYFKRRRTDEGDNFSQP
ncbi:MAG: TlyA family RNA methyltransferase, partial [Eubacteriales bacterium]|nr:TlyA family RNA methyltransferase [Eubacteriales bacterium]